MKTNFKSVTLSLAVVALLTACQPNDSKVDKKGKGGDAKPQTIEVDGNTQSAAELADAAEQLTGPYTFMLATKVADMALEKDPTNLKAQFYKKLLARTEVFRGILTRVKPVLSSEAQVEWARAKEKFPESPLKAFLYDPSVKPMKNVMESQDVLGDYTTAVKEFRTFLKNNRNSELVVNLNPHLFEEKIRNEAIKNCDVVEGPDNTMKVECDYKSAAQVRLNQADLLVLSQMASGELLYFGLLNSYSLDGLDKVAEMSKEKELSKEEFINKLLANPKFGKLRKDSALTMLKEMGADYSAAAKWALQYQQNLCPHGYGSEQTQRRGFLFKNGLCVENKSEAEDALAKLDQALSSVINIDLQNVNTDSKVSVNLDVFAWSKTPIQDLRSIAPTSYSPCGNVATIVDKTLGGMFVDGNVEQFLNTSCK